ncbi:MAG: dihydrofolate reductase [Chitinophagaceae bacterium]
MITSFVVAASENNVIGINNKLPWYLPNDLKYFKNTTWAMPVIMGRKTYESTGRPLPGRTNIIITRQKDWKADGVIVASDMGQALKAAADTDSKEAFIIGGGEIFKQYISKVDKIYITRIHANIKGDAYFPEIDEQQWKLISNLDFPVDEKHEYAYSFQVWQRN